MKPHTCPYCQQEFTLKHIGKCGPAMIELDENLKAQATKFKLMTPQELEAQIGIAMNALVNQYVAQHGKEPHKTWIMHMEKQIRMSARKLKGEI